jgi:hypothetical protein
VNALRRDHALDLDAVRRKQAAEKAAAAPKLSNKERSLQDAITGSFQTKWYHPRMGNTLFGGARTLEQALAWPRRK